MAKTMKKGTSICITSCKGGVGKTTTTLNLAGIYEAMGKKVLVIDLDLSNGGIAISLNRPYTKDIYTLFVDLKMNLYKEFSNYVVKYDDFIDVLPCSIDPRDANKIDSSLIDVILDRAAFLYDVILIDTTHVLNDLNLYTLDKVDKILFIVTNDAVDLKNMKSVLTIFRDLEIDKYKVLLNDSIHPFKGYFSDYDIKNIIKANIDYYLSGEFFIENIDKYVMDGKIITLDKKGVRYSPKDYSALLNIGVDLLNGGDEDE